MNIGCPSSLLVFGVSAPCRLWTLRPGPDQRQQRVGRDGTQRFAVPSRSCCPPGSLRIAGPVTAAEHFCQGICQLKRLLLSVLPPSLLKHLRAVDNYYNGGDSELHYVSRLCDRRKTAVDIGASIGVYTYFMQRHAAHVYAYEPVPALVELLRSSYPRGVTVIGKAVSDAAGSAELVMPVEQGRQMHELSSLAQDFSDKHETRTLQVPTVRLDDEDVGEPGLIKIEVQQHEQAVLAGAMETLRAHRPNLIVAWAPLLTGTDFRVSFAPLFELGYRCFFLFERKLHSADDYRPELHSDEANVGNRERFVTNLIFSSNDLIGGADDRR